MACPPPLPPAMPVADEILARLETLNAIGAALSSEKDLLTLLERILEVKGILRRRVSAKEVEAFLIDLTPAEEYARVAELEREAREGAPIPREAGTGRPTKRDRRDLDEMSGPAPDPEPTFEDFVRAFVRRRPLR